jgi:hypothetical protein
LSDHLEYFGLPALLYMRYNNGRQSRHSGVAAKFPIIS